MDQKTYIINATEIKTFTENTMETNTQYIHHSELMVYSYTTCIHVYKNSTTYPVLLLINKTLKVETHPYLMMETS